MASDNIDLNIRKLYYGMKHTNKASTSIDSLAAKISATDISGSDLSTKGNVPAAAGVVKSAGSKIANLAIRLDKTKIMLERNNEEVAKMFEYLEEIEGNGPTINIEVSTESVEVDDENPSFEEGVGEDNIDILTDEDLAIQKQQERTFEFIASLDEELAENSKTLADERNELLEKEAERAKWRMEAANMEVVPEDITATIDALDQDIAELEGKCSQLSEESASLKALRDTLFYNNMMLYGDYSDFDSFQYTANNASEIVTDVVYNPALGTDYNGLELHFYNKDEYTMPKLSYDPLDPDGYGDYQKKIENAVVVNELEQALYYYEHKELPLYEGVYPIPGKVTEYYNSFDYMTEDEIKVLRYLVNTGQTEKYEQFSNCVIDLAHRKEAKEIVDGIDGIDEKIEFYYGQVGTNGYTSADAYVDTVELLAAEGFKDGLNTFASGIDNLYYADGILSVQDYKTMLLLQNIQTRYGNEGTEKILSKITTGTYEIASSIGNMAMSATVSMIPGCQFVGLSLMGMSAAGNAREKATQQGLDDGGAWLYGILCGLSEAGLEYVLGGISSLASGKSVAAISEATGVGTFFAGLLSEAGEESLQSVLDPLFLTIASGGQIPYEIDWNEVLKSGIYGMITAGIMNGANGMVNIVINDISYTIDYSQAREVLNKFSENGESLDFLIKENRIQLMEILADMDPNYETSIEKKYTITTGKVNPTVTDITDYITHMDASYEVKMQYANEYLTKVLIKQKNADGKSILDIINENYVLSEGKPLATIEDFSNLLIRGITDPFGANTRTIVIGKMSDEINNITGYNDGMNYIDFAERIKAAYFSTADLSILDQYSLTYDDLSSIIGDEEVDGVIFLLGNMPALEFAKHHKMRIILNNDISVIDEIDGYNTGYGNEIVNFASIFGDNYENKRVFFDRNGNMYDVEIADVDTSSYNIKIGDSTYPVEIDSNGQYYILRRGHRITLNPRTILIYDGFNYDNYVYNE